MDIFTELNEAEEKSVADIMAKQPGNFKIYAPVFNSLNFYNQTNSTPELTVVIKKLYMLLDMLVSNHKDNIKEEIFSNTLEMLDRKNAESPFPPDLWKIISDLRYIYEDSVKVA